MAVSVDVQRIERAECVHFDVFSVVRVKSSGDGLTHLFFECEGHEAKAKAVADAINSK